MSGEWTRSDFDTAIPEMAGVDSTTYVQASADADSMINRAAFASAKLRRAGCLMTAHLIALNPPAGIVVQSGAVVSESVGGVSTTYAMRACGPGETVYLLAFRQLAAPGVIGGFVA